MMTHSDWIILLVLSAIWWFIWGAFMQKVISENDNLAILIVPIVIISALLTYLLASGLAAG